MFEFFSFIVRVFKRQNRNEGNENPTIVTEDKKDERRTDNISEWDQEFMKVDQAIIFSVKEISPRHDSLTLK